MSPVRTGSSSGLRIRFAGYVLLFAPFWPAQAQAQARLNPPYLNEMPAVERVVAEVKGIDPMDTAARQMGAFWQLQQMIKNLAGPRQYRNLTPDEGRLLGLYAYGYQQAEKPYESYPDRPKWFQMHSFYEVDDAFLDELLQKFFSPGLRGQYLQVLGEKHARALERSRAAEKARSQAQPAAGTSRTAPSSAPSAEGKNAAAAPTATPSTAPVGSRTGPTPHTATNAPAGSAANAPAPSPAEKYISQGIQFFNAKQYLKAIEAFQKAIALKPDNKTLARAYRSLGNIYAEIEQYEKAIPALEDALHLEPNTYNDTFTLGWACFNAKQYEKALTALNVALKLKPDSGDCYYWIGRTYADGLKQPEKAIAAYRESLRLQPNHAGTLQVLGNAYRDLEQFAEAEAALKEAIRLKPEMPNHRFWLGILYLDMGKKEEAQQVQQALQKMDAKMAKQLADEIDGAFDNEDDPVNLFGDGVLSMDAGLYSNALRCFRRVLIIAGDVETKSDAQVAIGRVYIEQSRYQKALSVLTEALRLKPDNHYAFYESGRALNALGHYERALGALQRAGRLKPDYADVPSEAGFALYKLGQYPRAVAALQQAIRLKPDYAMAHFNLGYVYLAMGRKAEACEEQKILQSLDKDLAKNLLDEINKRK